MSRRFTHAILTALAFILCACSSFFQFITLSSGSYTKILVFSLTLSIITFFASLAVLLANDAAWYVRSATAVTCIISAILFVMSITRLM